MSNVQCEQSVPQHKQIFSYHIYTSKINQYYTYIDDIFLAWAYTKQKLLVFLEDLNSEHKTIKFEHNISQSNIPFLHTLLCNGKNNSLQKTLYQKPNDQQSYLHPYSNHPKSFKKSIQYSKALKIKSTVPKKISWKTK